MDDVDLARQAADPGTPLTTLHRLAQDHPGLRAAIATNPSTYPALLGWLGRLGVPEIDAALAARAEPALPPSIPPASPRREARDEPASGRDRPSRRGSAAQPVLPPSIPPRTTIGDRLDDAGAEDFPTGNITAVLAPAGRSVAVDGVDGVDGSGATDGDRAVDGGADDGTGTDRDAGAVDGTGRTTPVAGIPVAAGSPAAAPVAGHPSDGRPTRPRARWALIVVVAVLLVGALVWALSQRGDDDDATAPASTTATADPGETAPAAPARARAALVALPAASACSDVAADAQVFSAYARATAADGAWTDPTDGEVVTITLAGLQEACGAAHAVAVNDALVADPEAPAALVTRLTTATDWVALARHAPPGAQERTSFASPSGNIACSLGADAASCTITKHAFAPPEGCAAGPVTLVVGAGGDARVDCAVPAAAANGTLEYGQAATAGRFACTSEQTGVSCWSVLNGHGFSVARAGVSVF
ncbi:hypothetical protein [Georgenia sp. SYP-B2076]|uniref:variant leucine-rich repeat-containing protein n=1 Tax=Georgenia sp. SYP-B2076 TaxID=2495881 RepID=UPI0013E06EDE|nr:hypothetical protein [Georgenia sp. SYP-B2076]